MNYGFVINNDTCIGCHACSTACKSENEVPLGVHRTWVKSVEVGAFPDVKRHFQVTRCNHCANPPCVAICPVTAMYQRDDGIVEFDKDLCIGCKACLQACPYDAIHVDPETGTAAKCHYCAHRTDIGLEPACVVVCPEHAIIAGDLDDPGSEISRVLADNKVTVRKPERGTSPKLFYVSGAEATLHPTAVSSTPATYAWADSISDRQAVGGPMTRVAGQMTQAAYNAQHKMPWHWPVPAYLVTKAISAGIALWLAATYLLGVFRLEAAPNAVLLAVSVVFTAVTTGLLVFDLERPERFLRILTRPQWRSWLVRGAYLLVGFSGVTGIWMVLEFLGLATDELIRPALSVLTIPFALGAAAYTAFLFGQAHGRELWQSSMLPFHLVVQSVMAGTGAILVTYALVGALASDPLLTETALGATRVAFVTALVLNLAITLVAEFAMPHGSEAAAIAARDMTAGRYRQHFWLGGILLGHIGPLVLLMAASGLADAVAGVATIIGLYLYEYAFVMAPQHVPNA